MDDLTLIIPAKNEEVSLPHVLDELVKYKYKIIVVLEESDLSTIKSITNKNCKILFQKGKGYGDALINGIHNVDSKYFCIFNADGSFIPEEIKNMLDLVKNNTADLIFGSRYMKGGSSEDDTIITLVGNKIFTFLGNLFFSLNLSDILYTFVIGKTHLTKKLNLKEKKFSFCVELPIKAKRFKYKIISYPCHERIRIGGIKKVNAFKDGLLILFSMIKLFFFTKSETK